MTSFGDLRAFQRALDLMVDVYRVTESFPRHELYGLTSQLRRAACSIVSNIAEGQGRLTYGERRQLMSQARGSLYEVHAQVIAAERLGFLAPDVANRLHEGIDETARELAGLITWIQRREGKTTRSKKEDWHKPQA